MNGLTAAEVQVLVALAERPKTVEEVARSVADVGMYLGSDHVGSSIDGPVDMGLAERTPAEHLGKYRITSAGRTWMGLDGPGPLTEGGSLLTPADRVIQ